MSAERESPRKRSRAAALQVLFSLEFAGREVRGADEDPKDGGEEAADGAEAAAEPTEDVGDAPAEGESGSSLAARAQAAFDEVGAHFELPEGARAFAKELVLGVARHRGSLDRQIGEHANNWRIERMASVDRNVLRLGAYELLHGDAPVAVVIDEAVELARRFGGDRSPGFVNGVLDALAAAVRPPEPG